MAWPGKVAPDAMALTKRRFSIDEWADSPFNTPLSEMVDGIPVERMATSGQHAVLVKRLERWLDRAEAAGYGERFSGPAGVVLDADEAKANVREPDVCFFRRDRAIVLTTVGIEGVPDLVIDVLSPGNRQDDLPEGSVWHSYERFGVPSYWIVDMEAQTVAQYANEHGRFREGARLRIGDELASPLFPGIVLSVADIFVGLSR